MTGDNSGLDPRWRQRIQEDGKDLFVKQEMIRLGFWKPGENLQLSDSEREKFVAGLEQSYQYLSELRKDLAAVRREITSLGDVKALMKVARARRIERVGREREERKKRKAEETHLRQQEDQLRRKITPPFLGHGVSSQLTYDGCDKDRLSQFGLPVINNVKDLAEHLDINEGEVAWLAYHRNAVRCEHYTRFIIPKRSGGDRVISAPKPQMKSAQDWINREVLARVSPEACATAYVKGANILDNARRHSGKGLVIRLDIRNFFPSYTFPRVRGVFKSLGYNPGISSVLALVCTESPRVHAMLNGESWYVATGQRRLPQGAPTSPALSNLLARRLDRRLSGLARSLDPHWEYSRYADDMVFSHPHRTAPVGGLLKGANCIVDDEGLSLNDSKTAVMRQPHRQVVTGLLVNDTPRIQRSSLRKFRAFIHRCETQGFESVSEEIGVDAQAHARGYASFVSMIMPEMAKRLCTKHSWLVGP